MNTQAVPTVQRPRVDSSVHLPDGRCLAYAEYADADGAPVILFHGLPGSRLSWGMLPGSPFPPGLRIIAPDRPGYGGSEPKPGRTLLEWADDVRALADALELERFAVVGVSGGGPGALACAFRMPERLTSVGVVSGAAPTNAPGVFRGMSRTNRFFTKLAWRLPWLSDLNTRLIASVVRRNPLRYIDTMSTKPYSRSRESEICLRRTSPRPCVPAPRAWLTTLLQTTVARGDFRWTRSIHEYSCGIASWIAAFLLRWVSISPG